MAGGPQNITDANFEQEVLKSEKPVLVDFYAEWCGPCKVVSPIIDELGEGQAKHVKVVKVNVDECSETCGRYGIMSVPTVVLFKDGVPSEQMVGARSKKDYENLIESQLQS